MKMKGCDSMVFMRIHCGACGGQWEVYRRGRDTAAARACPHCDFTIDGDTWVKKILPAFQAVGAANMELEADHIEKHTGEFQVDFLADGKFQNEDTAVILNEISALQQKIDDLKRKARSART